MRTKVGKWRSRFSPLNSLFLGLALFFLWIAIDELKTTVRFSDIFYLNATLTQEDSANAVAIGRFAAEAEAVITNGECRADVVSGGMTFVLRDLDMQDVVDHYDAWAASMARADRYITHALSCNPGDGDLWARLAMIRQASSENADQVFSLMNRSAVLAPSEMYVIRARFFVWRKATVATLNRSADILKHDINTVLNYGDPNDIVDVLAHAGDNLKPHILEAAKLIPAARMAALRVEHIDPLRSAIYCGDCGGDRERELK
ncbi:MULTISPECIES: hypothetical protein [unclassified Rhizobium]|uniref:hypothetical protein n=1 Tax=Rhizobium sp. L58/93 TaxID=2820000 RepID=UPI001ADCEC5C|nr:hypothetical protein [Rhizobium sp. L58/93]MBO9099405.1 hypothetical protein [Rhizobium sp. L58/93]QXZ92859.1 hypothetical protein J5280_19675 [Rhizobium sp. K15/93]